MKKSRKLKKEVNTIFIRFTVVVIVLSILFVTGYKVINIHFDKLNLVEEKYIIEHAKKCYIDKVCNNKTVTLKELYDLNYLDKRANPITKVYYNTDSYIKYENNNYKFVIIK